MAVDSKYDEGEEEEEGGREEVEGGGEAGGRTRGDAGSHGNRGRS